MAQQPPPPPAGPPADYFMTPPPGDAAAALGAPPDGAGFALPQAQPGYQAAPYYGPAPAAAGVGVGLISQFTGAALTSCVLGVVTVVVPFVFGYVFYVLPIAGILAGLRAIQRGKVIGGAAGIGLNVVGGLITVIALKL